MGGTSLRIVVGTFAVMLSWSAAAHDGSGKALVTTNKVTSAAIASMSLQDLMQLDNELRELWAQLKAARRPKTDFAAEVPLIHAYTMYETQESVRSLINRLNAELRQEEQDISIPLVRACLDAIGEIASAKPAWQLRDLQEIRKIAGQQLGARKEGAAALKDFDQVLLIVKTNMTPLKGVQEMIANLQNTPANLKVSLDKMADRLQKRIKGQPELVEAFVGLEWDNQMERGTRTLPDFVYLLGLPGVGKDTGAEAFTDALWDTNEAYKEHLFRLPIMRGPPELWQVLGSTTGYSGHDAFPPFLEFLVKHSGGRYLMAQVPGDKPMWKVIENPSWKGKPLPGYATPDKAVVFANELHNWSKNNKDLLLKQSLEKGYFTINSPNGGLSELYVPVRFVMASNEGIPLLTSRESNGQRYGKPLTYEQMLEKWRAVRHNKNVLRAEILAGNGAVNTPGKQESAVGTSEEFLNRLQPDEYILLLRPLSPETLREIAAIALGEIKAKLQVESGFFMKADLRWDDSIVPFIQEYDYMPEDNARPIKANVKSLIQKTLLRALREGDIPLESEKKNVTFTLGVQKNEDGTVSLLIDYSESGKKPQRIVKLIDKTTKDIPPPALSDEQIRKLMGIATKLKERVFGVDVIADRIADRILAIENQRTANTEESRRVSVIVALGLTSTGKTELAKAIASELLGSDTELKTYDFSQIQTMHDFQTRILGTRDALGNPVKSDFMKAYDRANGKMVVAFDELANVRDRELLTALYDFFREPIMNTFSDGVPRKMGGILTIVTGNAGQELYANVPRDLPMDQQMAAWQDISEKVAADLEMQRRILERYFPAPLVTRWGKNNTFFFPPHTFKSLRQLAQLKLEKELARLANTKSRRGWNMLVPDAHEYSKLIDAIVEEGFSLRYQGASVDSFILEDLGEALESTLLKALVPAGANVVMKFTGKTENHDKDKPGNVEFKLFVDGQATPLDFKFKRPHVEKPLVKDETQQRITAYHEAGHSILQQIFFYKTTKAGMISIIPGITNIDDEWVAYAGIAQWQQIGREREDRDFIVQEIAGFAAGEVAERLVTKGATHGAGKSNDMKRASRLAQLAVLRFGLSEAWGTRAIPADMSLSDYLSSLSEKDKELLNVETNKLIEEGQALARHYLELNFKNALIPLGNLLTEKGKVEAEEMQEFYEKNALNRTPPTKKSAAITAVKKWFSRDNPNSGDSSLRTDFKVPAKVANVVDIVEARKRAQFDSVPMPAKLPVGTNASYETWSKQQSPDCSHHLLKKAG